MSNIFDRVDKLIEMMAKRNIEAYIVPTSDPHQSEYLSTYYKTREYISGFTGSAGIAVITHDKAGLWTDGRYFVQAERELKNTPFELYRMGEDITYIEFIKEETNEFSKIAVDGKIFSLDQYDNLTKSIGDRLLITDLDFISEIWNDRPEISKAEVFIFEEKYTGQSYKDKLRVLRTMMESRDVDYTFIGALEDVAYLFNLRGSDIYATPVFFAYALVGKENVKLFIDENKIDSEVRKYLEENNVELYHYESVYESINEIAGTKTVYLDPSRTNVLIYQNINKNVKIKRGINLTTLMKALKNETEIKNAKRAYIKDGVALVKFFNWLETGIKSIKISEVVAANKLLELRQEQENFLEVSFETISAYGENAAMPHYDPNKVTPKDLEEKGLYLCDSGAQYLEGTTDITRTIALGKLTDDERKHYTLTLKALIAGMTVKFPKKTTGAYIDAVVRTPLYKEGLDFNHGTGHGVGFVLGVHEGPMRLARVDGGIPLEEGMFFSIEPGIYIAGSHGIRLENIVFVKKSEYENMLELESLVYVPIDTRPIYRYMLDSWEVEWLNNYNKLVREKLEGELKGADLEYLNKVTQEI